MTILARAHMLDCGWCLCVLKAAIANATTLEEVERLNRMLQTGQLQTTPAGTDMALRNGTTASQQQHAAAAAAAGKHLLMSKLCLFSLIQFNIDIIMHTD